MLARYRSTLLAAAALGGYSVFLLDSTYLDPLPWRAGQIGVVLLLIASLGAGMLSGWRWATVFLLAACGVGLVLPSASLMSQSRRWWSDYGNATDDVLFLLVLVPVAIGAGALMARFGRRSWIPGAAILALPLAIVAWAGFRHARPINVHPAHPITLSYPRYRGVYLGEPLPKALSVLGKPGGPSLRSVSDADYASGHDVFEFTARNPFDENPARHFLGIIEIRDPSAQTAEGVGIGDSLSLAKSRLRARCYHTDGYGPDPFQPECFAALPGDRQVIFIGDPIEWIKMD